LKNSFTIILLFYGILAFAQESGDTRIIYGRVISQDSISALPNTHVINKRTYVGTITNGLGDFRMEAQVGDTIVFSNISYQFHYHQVTGNENFDLTIKLKVRNYLIDEVSVDAYRLTSNDPKPMAIGKPMIPRNEDIRTPEPLAPTLANPVDYLYYLFSRKPKQFEKLRELYAQDAYRYKLQEGNNRDIVVQLTGIDREELEAFMFYCKYAGTTINMMNDYEYVMSLLRCYDKFQREQAVREIMDTKAKSNEAQKVIEQRFTDD